jgi:hypothetical protein
MKKLYSLIFTAVFLCSSFSSLAQSIYNSILSNPLNYNLDDGRFWQEGFPPPNPCIGCAITINSDVSMMPGTSSLNDIVLNNSTLSISGGVTLTINTYVELNNTQVIVGSDATTFATVILNDQVDLNGTSSVQLANLNCSVDARNIGTPPDFIPGTIEGPHDDFDATSKSAGIFGVLATPDGGGYLYSYVLVSGYIGTYNNEFSSGTYSMNCDDGGPNSCATGVIYGPATSTTDPTFGIIFKSSPTLPVQIVQFIASKNPDASIKLSWATAQEANSASFDVERSADLASWQKIGDVAAKGYSSVTTNYTYTDRSPLAGNGYYRLKMIDLDGKFQYSQVVSVSSDKNSLPLVVYSNPFSDQIRVKVNVSKAENLTLTVTDIIGKTYLKQGYNAQAGDNLINLVPAGASSGMYILHIQGNTYEQTVKLAKQ